MYRIARSYPTGTGVVNDSPWFGFPLAPATRYAVSRDTTAANIADVGYKQSGLPFALVTIRATAIQQAPIVLFDPAKPDEPVEKEVPLLTLLRNPNELYDESSLQAVTEIYGCIGSDAYQYKVRDNYEQVMQLYPYHASQIQPIQGEFHWIECYRYNNGAGHVIDLPVEDVIQFRWNSVDFNRPYKSVGPLVANANEVDIDNDRAAMAKALLQNGAMPAFLLELAENATMPDANGNYRPPTQEQLERLGERMQERFGTKNRGKGGIVPSGTKVHQLGFSPKDMTTTDFVTIPETRLCTSFGVPIQMTSLYSAKDARTYANYEAAKRSFYEDTMRPRWTAFSRTYTKSFKNERFRGDNKEYVIAYDLSKVPALQDNELELRERAQDEFTKGLTKLNEARETIGLEDDAQYGEQYYWELEALSKAPVDPATKDFQDEQGAKLAERVKKSGRGVVRSYPTKKMFAL